MKTGFSPAARVSGQSVSSSPLPSSSAGHHGSGPPMYRSVVVPKKPSSSLIKIMTAKMKLTAKKGGKPEFQCTGEMYIELTDAKANIGHACEAVHEQWGSEYTVVSVEGLEIDDTLAMQGQYSCSIMAL